MTCHWACSLFPLHSNHSPLCSPLSLPSSGLHLTSLPLLPHIPFPSTLCSSPNHPPLPLLFSLPLPFILPTPSSHLHPTILPYLSFSLYFSPLPSHNSIFSINPFLPTVLYMLPPFITPTIFLPSVHQYTLIHSPSLRTR